LSEVRAPLSEVAESHELTPPRTPTLCAWINRALLGTALLALAFGAMRVLQLERAEQSLESAPSSLRALMTRPHATAISVRLGEATLRANQHGVFELCGADGLNQARWLGVMDVAILHLEGKQLMLRVPFDAAHLDRVRRNREAGCLLLGSGLIEHTGTYSVEAVWPKRLPPTAALDVPLQLRILAKSTLGPRERGCVVVLGLAVLALLVSYTLFGRARSNDARQSAPAQPIAPRLTLAAFAMLVLYGVSQLPSPGSTFTLAKGMLLLASQCALAYGLARGFARADIASALGLVAPPRRLLAFGSALATWPLLVSSARLALRWVPSTGESPIQSFISWPSGMLAAALLGVLLPFAEELFFRGYLYAALFPLGRFAAAGVSVLLFGLMHAEQSWGNWGGLAAVFAAGSVLCALRVVTGSTLICALTHVAYNLTLSLASISEANL
jgi:membrane protease YdiL (CAAX protease family)